MSATPDEVPALAEGLPPSERSVASSPRIAASVAQQMERLEQLLAFVPNRVLATQVKSQRSSPKAAVTDEWAVTSFIDIKGYTTFCHEIVAKYGNDSPEIVNSKINEYFSVVVETLYDYEGDIITFAGDAMLVVFEPKVPALKDGTRSVEGSEAERDRATEAAKLDAIMRALEATFKLFRIRTSRDGTTTFPFELHVGVGYGPIQSVCVGSGTALSGGWMFYVGGNGIDTMLEAFNAATGANQVRGGPSAAAGFGGVLHSLLTLSRPESSGPSYAACCTLHCKALCLDLLAKPALSDEHTYHDARTRTHNARARAHTHGY